MPPVVTVVSLVTIALQELPEVGALIAQLFAAGKTSTEDINAALADLATSDADVAAAYARLYPGQAPPGA